MDERAVVTCFLRSGTEILLVRRGEGVGADRGPWDGVSGDAEGAPDEAARREIREAVGLLAASERRRAADPIPVEDPDLGRRWVVHPYLFDCASRAVDPGEAVVDHEWVHPPAMLDRGTVPALWAAYTAVAPTVETVRDDEAHGAAYLSVRALEVLRDAAAEAALEGGSPGAVADRARALRAARPRMGVVANRVNRAMHEAGDDGDGLPAPAAVREAATAACGRAVDADRRAAETAAETVGDRVLTLSRSGTVRSALRRAAPEAVYVAESRPGREGVAAAEELADDLDVTLFPDAAVAAAIEAGDVDTVLVGADTVLADGDVVNKVGTRPAALAAEAAGVDCYAVCSRDKIVPDAGFEAAAGAAGDLYDGAADVAVRNPTFERVPAARFEGLLTERGPLATAAVESTAAEHAALAEWEGP